MTPTTDPSLRQSPSSSPRCPARPDRGSTAADPTTTFQCSTRRPHTDRYMAPSRAPHLWCICVTPLHRLVRTKESHTPPGAPEEGQMRQEILRCFVTWLKSATERASSRWATHA